MQHDATAVADFGGQYAQLVATDTRTIFDLDVPIPGVGPGFEELGWTTSKHGAPAQAVAATQQALRSRGEPCRACMRTTSAFLPWPPSRRGSR